MMRMFWSLIKAMMSHLWNFKMSLSYKLYLENVMVFKVCHYKSVKKWYKNLYHMVIMQLSMNFNFMTCLKLALWKGTETQKPEVFV